MILGDGGGSSLSIAHSLLEPERSKKDWFARLVCKTGLSADLCNWAASPWFHRIGSTELAMLILKPQDVEIVKILHPVTQKRIAILGYQGIFFRPIKTFDLNRRPEVLALCRKISEEHKRTCVILAEPERYSLWGKVTNPRSKEAGLSSPSPYICLAKSKTAGWRFRGRLRCLQDVLCCWLHSSQRHPAIRSIHT